jgi:hypothetical protein
MRHEAAKLGAGAVFTRDKIFELVGEDSSHGTSREKPLKAFGSLVSNGYFVKMTDGFVVQEPLEVASLMVFFKERPGEMFTRREIVRITGLDLKPAHVHDALDLLAACGHEVTKQRFFRQTRTGYKVGGRN